MLATIRTKESTKVRMRVLHLKISASERSSDLFLHIDVW